jgi:hypothetical protein
MFLSFCKSFRLPIGMSLLTTHFPSFQLSTLGSNIFPARAYYFLAQPLLVCPLAYMYKLYKTFRSIVFLDFVYCPEF